MLILEVREKNVMEQEGGLIGLHGYTISRGALFDLPATATLS
jgi:hypothetical protein